MANDHNPKQTYLLKHCILFISGAVVVCLLTAVPGAIMGWKSLPWWAYAVPAIIGGMAFLMFSRSRQTIASLRRSIESFQMELAERERVTDGAIEFSEAQLKVAFEQVPLGCQVLDDKGCLLDINQKWTQLFGYEHSEVEGKFFGDYLAPDDRRQFETDLSRLQVAGEIHEVEYQFLHKDGSLVNIELDGKATSTVDGKYQRIRCILRNVTQQKQTRLALQKSESHYRNVVENQMELMSRFRPDGTITFINEKFCQFFGKDREDLVGHSQMRLIPDRERDKVDRYFASLGRDNLVGTLEHQVLLSTGQARWLCRTDRAVFDDEARLVEFQSTARDVTERKKAEEALRESEEKFRLLSEQSAMGILILQDDVIKYANQALADITELSIDELLEMGPGEFAKLVHPDDMSFVMEQAQKKQSGAVDAVTSYFVRARTKSGKVKWLENYSRTISHRGATADLAILIDITERKEAEESLLNEKQIADAVISSLPGIFYLIDENGKYVRWNWDFEENLGYTPDEIRKMSALDVIHPDDQTQVAERIREVFETGSSWVEARLVSRDGAVKTYHFTGRRVEIGDKRYLTGTGVSTTDLIKVQEEKNKERNTLEKVISLNP